MGRIGRPHGFHRRVNNVKRVEKRDSRERERDWGTWRRNTDEAPKGMGECSGNRSRVKTHAGCSRPCRSRAGSRRQDAVASKMGTRIGAALRLRHRRRRWRQVLRQAHLSRPGPIVRIPVAAVMVGLQRLGRPFRGDGRMQVIRIVFLARIVSLLWRSTGACVSMFHGGKESLSLLMPDAHIPSPSCNVLQAQSCPRQPHC